MCNLSKKVKILISVAILIAIILLGIGVGSVYISPIDIARVLSHKLFSATLPSDFDLVIVGLVWEIRMPRVFLAFVVGAALSVSGTVMQSVMRNPLASSYTLGVSSGAGLGVAILISLNISIPFLGLFTLPIVGLTCGLITVLAVISFSSAVNKNMDNSTIILIGMVISLFINAIMSTVAALNKENSQKILQWSMGSFSLKNWSYVLALTPIAIIGIIILISYSRELDILTFGEQQARSMGVKVARMKWILLGISAMLTGSAIAFVGIIGFVDLIAPHVVRRFFGSSHRFVIPMSAVFGGGFMVIADLIARTVISPSELSVGAVTAIIGAPFFGYVYFKGRGR